MQVDEASSRNETSNSKTLSPLLGALSLAAIFFLAASLTWTYLARASSQTAAALVPLKTPASLPQPQVATSSFSGVSLLAKSAIVVDETTGQVLYALHPDTQLPLASLKKVALVLSVGQVMPPDTVITIPFDTGYNPRGGSLYKGELWRLQDVINFTIAISSNQGADILAQVANDAIHTAFPASPAQGATLWRMNNLVQSLGLTDMYFLNDNGLDVSTTQSGGYGTARDVASLLDYAVQTMPERFAATTIRTFTVTSIDGSHVDAINTDEALPDIPNIILGKTGYTDLAGGNLAVCFKSNGDTVCAVVLGSTFYGRFADMKTLVADTHAALSSRSTL